MTEVTISGNEEAPSCGDARALLARLYREIGVSAVASALQIQVKEPVKRRPSVDDIPVVLRDVDKAA